MSRRRSANSGDVSSVVSYDDDNAPAAAAAAASAYAAASAIDGAAAAMSDGEEEKEGVPLPARPSENPEELMKNLLSGISFLDVATVCHSLKPQLQQELSELPLLYIPLQDVALAQLRRAGREGEQKDRVKSSVAKARRELERCIKKEEQLTAIIHVLQELGREATNSEIKHDVDWEAHIQAKLSELMTSEAQKAKLEKKLRAALDAFDEKCWHVNHDGEAMPGRENEPVALAARGPTAADVNCCITTEYFEDPVKSRSCGHSYSRHAIHDLLLKKQAAGGGAAAASGELRPDTSITCPRGGCRQPVSLAVLVDDPATARLVAKAQAEERKRAEQGGAAAAAAGRGGKRARVKAEMDLSDGTQPMGENDEEKEGGPAAAAAASPQRPIKRGR